MMNVIKNSQWREGPTGGPMFFSGSNQITFDDFAVNGYRSCSVTMPNGEEAKDAYDLLIQVKNARQIQFGMKIRATDITYMSYVMEFYDDVKDYISTQVNDETRSVMYQYTNVFSIFDVPENATYAKVYWNFKDKVTACTYFAPQAYIK